MASTYDLINEIDKLSESQLAEKLAEYGHVVKNKAKWKDNQKVVNIKLLKHYVAKEGRDRKLQQSMILPKSKGRKSQAALNATFNSGVFVKDSMAVMERGGAQINEAVLAIPEEPNKKRGRPKAVVAAVVEKQTNPRVVLESLTPPFTKRLKRTQKQASKRGRKKASITPSQSPPQVLKYTEVSERRPRKERSDKGVQEFVLDQLLESDAEVDIVQDEEDTYKKGKKKQETRKSVESSGRPRGRPKAAAPVVSKRGRKRKSLAVETPDDDDEEEEAVAAAAGHDDDDDGALLMKSTFAQVSMSSPDVAKSASLAVECVEVVSGEGMQGLHVVLSQAAGAGKWKKADAGVVGSEDKWEHWEGMQGSYKVTLKTGEWFKAKSLTTSQPMIEVYIDKEDAGVGHVLRVLVSPCFHSVMLSQHP